MRKASSYTYVSPEELVNTNDVEGGNENRARRQKTSANEGGRDHTRDGKREGHGTRTRAKRMGDAYFCPLFLSLVF
jgi:hypothetical protein